MVDTRFYKKLSDNYKLTDLAQLIGANLTPTVSVQNEVMINDIRPIELAQSGDLTFLSNKKYLAEFKNTKASACIVPEDIIAKPENPIFLLKVKNPYFAYAKLIEVFYTSAKPNIPEISSSALISKHAKIGNNCYIGPGVVIEDNVVIGDDSVIEAGTFIDLGVVIGKRAKIRSNVSISYAVIGDDVVILPGARIGQDGFGFATNAGVHHKIYHTGLVVIGNNVEIGANTTIDRGSMNDTIIEDLCRIDNLVQIGHNVHIGKGSIIVAQAGIAGSSKIGNYCALGGQAGVAGHMSVADKVQIAAQGGVIQNINEVGVIVGGTPTVPIRDWHRQSIIMKQLLKNRR